MFDVWRKGKRIRGAIQNSLQLVSNADNCHHMTACKAGGSHFVSIPAVGEVEWVLWAANAELSSILEKLSGLMTKTLRLATSYGLG